MTNKMIEEMAKIIDDRLIEANNYLGSMNKGKGYWIAQKLVEHYQPKIPDGSVVLTNDEWARLRNLEINYNDAYEAYCEYAIQNKGLREENTQLRLENNHLEAQVEQAHKEAVKEFLTELFKQYSVFNDNDVIIAWQVKEALKNTLKQLGVEVEK